jgi:hypothetical protein
VLLPAPPLELATTITCIRPSCVWAYSTTTWGEGLVSTILGRIKKLVDGHAVLMCKDWIINAYRYPEQLVC